jgi:2-dehydro-3-deoxy-L-rhamnonate dehydrogenase (NAD+)
MTAKIPLRRCGELAEAAQTIAWIVSPACSFTSGFTFDLIGGRATYQRPRLKRPLRSSTGRFI